MLGKMIKYDWRSVSRVNTLMAVVLGGYALIVAVMMQTPMYSGFITGHEVSESIQVFGLISGAFGVLGLLILMGGARLACTIYLGVRFFKSMFEEEGYLTHTLPATSREVVASRLIVGVLWKLIINLVVVISCGFIALSVVILAVRTGVSLKEIWDKILELPYLIIGDLLEDFKGAIVHGVIYGVLYVLLDPFISIANVFGALTIGQCFKKNRGLLGVVMYFVIAWGTNFVMMIVKGIGQVMMIDDIYSLDEKAAAHFVNLTMFLNYDLELIVTFGVAIALVFIMHNIVDKHLNLI